MKPVVLLALLGWSCATVVPLETDIQVPELVSQVPLPAPTRLLQGKPLRLELKLHIAEDGSVREALFVLPSGDPEWDSEALEKVRQWTFSPALFEGRPVSIWIRQSIMLQFCDQLMMPLAEIRCSARELADSVVAALRLGADFAELARQFSEGPSAVGGGALGEVDIRSYPQAAQEELRGLRPGEHTSPIRIGPQYVVFRRVPEEKPK